MNLILLTQCFIYALKTLLSLSANFKFKLICLSKSLTCYIFYFFIDILRQNNKLLSLNLVQAHYNNGTRHDKKGVS